MALSNTTTLNDLIGSVVDSLVQEFAYALEVMKPICRFRQIEEGFDSIVIPRWATIAIGALTEATAPTAAALSTDGVTLTPTERGVLVTIGLRALRGDPFDDLEPYARTLGRSMGADSDSLILADMEAKFSVTVNDGAGLVDVTLAFFQTAIATLLAADAPTPYFCVLHPGSWAKIMAELDDASAFGVPGSQVVEGHGRGMPKDQQNFVAAPFGVPIYLSSQVDSTRDTNETYANIMMSQEAYGVARTFDMRVDTDKNVPARAFDLMAWYAQASDELVDAYAVVLEDQVNPA